jgi:hypothetical protein
VEPYLDVLLGTHTIRIWMRAARTWKKLSRDAPVVAGVVSGIDVVSVHGSKRVSVRTHAPSSNLSVCLLIRTPPLKTHSIRTMTERPAQTGVLSHPLSSPPCQFAEAEATSAPGFAPGHGVLSRPKSS